MYIPNIVYVNVTMYITYISLSSLKSHYEKQCKQIACVCMPLCVCLCVVRFRIQIPDNISYNRQLGELDK